jgi:hypothetical protein
LVNTFSDQIGGVSGKIIESIDLAGWPVDFDSVGHAGLAEAEVEPWVGR